jgi:MYXO-CTERM domain-containing protein
MVPAQQEHIMNFLHKALVAVPVVFALALACPSDADACGGCFVPPEESTQVTGHRMILSIGMTQSTLYDQIEYSGDPSEFAWVLPIRGTVEIGVSSDLVFNQLGVDTAVTVLPPVQNCPVYDNCYDEDAAFGSSSGGGPQSEGGVTVIAEEVVGPYETVQLQSSNPTALNEWLEGHGYSVPTEIQPIIASYIADGFNFLAMKLIPGVGTDKMKPVRITTQGAGAALPLKMVAAGTGATTTMTLYVLGEGRYEPTNFPAFTIPDDAVVWNYESFDSNYTELRTQAYEATSGFGWLVEASKAYSAINFEAQVLNVVDFVGPQQSGYGDDDQDWEAARLAAEEDMRVMFSGMNANNVVVTRLRAEMSRAGLATDMVLGASDTQGEINNLIQTKSWVGTQPACLPPPDCSDNGFGWGSGYSDDDGGSNNERSSGCAVSSDEGDDSTGAFGFGATALLLMVSLRRRRRRLG